MTNTTDQTDALPPGTVIGRLCRIDSVLSRGGFAFTYFATLLETGETVVLKELFPRALARRAEGRVVPRPGNEALLERVQRQFEREAQILARLSHPGIVRYRALVADRGTAFMLLDAVTGPTFEDWLRTNAGPPDEAVLRPIFEQLFSTLDYLARRGVRHRDIVPRNIILKHGKTPILIDFGVAAVDGAGPGDLANPRYAPPEQVEPDKAEGPFSEVYYVAGCLYRAVVGRPPHHGRDLGTTDDGTMVFDGTLATATQIQSARRGAPGRAETHPSATADALAPERYSADFLSAIDHALDPDSDRRPATMADLRRALGWGEPPLPEADGMADGESGARPAPLALSLEEMAQLRAEDADAAHGAPEPEGAAAVTPMEALAEALAKLQATPLRPPPASAPALPPASPPQVHGADAPPAPAPDERPAEAPAPAMPPEGMAGLDQGLIPPAPEEAPPAPEPPAASSAPPPVIFLPPMAVPEAAAPAAPEPAIAEEEPVQPAEAAAPETDAVPVAPQVTEPLPGMAEPAAQPARELPAPAPGPLPPFSPPRDWAAREEELKPPAAAPEPRRDDGETTLLTRRGWDDAPGSSGLPRRKPLPEPHPVASAPMATAPASAPVESAQVQPAPMAPAPAPSAPATHAPVETALPPDAPAPAVHPETEREPWPEAPQTPPPVVSGPADPPAPASALPPEPVAEAPARPREARLPPMPQAPSGQARPNPPRESSDQPRGELHTRELERQAHAAEEAGRAARSGCLTALATWFSIAVLAVVAVTIGARLLAPQDAASGTASWLDWLKGLLGTLGVSGASAMAPANAPRDVVDFTVFGPKALGPEEDGIIQVFLHRVEETGAVGLMAGAIDPDAEPRGGGTLEVELAYGETVSVLLSCPELEAEAPEARMVWRGCATACQLAVRLKAGAAPGTATVRLYVMREGVAIGHLMFKLRLLADRPAQPQPQAPGLLASDGHAHRRAFLSYASSDRLEVLKRAQGLRAAGVDFFQDLLSLTPGERWEQRLWEEIDHCDVFYLFWSRSACASEWVLRELDHARSRRGAGEVPAILPVILEAPPASPPPGMEDIHFDDPICHVISAHART